MVAQIETHYKVAFADKMRLAAQQTTTELQRTCINEMLEGEKTFFDGYGQVAVGERLTRNAMNSYKEMPRERRMISPRFFDYPELFDQRDRGRTLRALEPDGLFMEAVIGAFNRKKDNVIFEAFTASAYSDKSGSTPVEFDTDQDVAHNSESFLTTDKLRAGRKILRANNVKGKLFGAGHPDQLDDLLGQTAVTNADYSHVKALADGDITSFMGIDFVWTTEITDGNFYLYSPDAMIFGHEGDIDVNFDVQSERGHALQLAVYATFAATRYYENKIVRIDCAV